nr:hypothetical protein [Arsenophonus endosymbiont of Aleurodicus floccissimus]
MTLSFLIAPILSDQEKAYLPQICVNCLNENGIFVAQNDVCFLQQDKVINSYKKLSNYFNDCSFYQAAIPSYYGGMMTFAWASQTAKLRQITLQILENRFKKAEIICRYYTSTVSSQLRFTTVLTGFTR